jgi:hypothetical protein
LPVSLDCPFLISFWFSLTLKLMFFCSLRHRWP